MSIQLEESWLQYLAPEFDESYMQKLKLFLKEEKRQGRVVYPPGNLIFNAFSATPFEKVKVVILGQDPYHNPAQAMGLSFSVPDGVQPPPSLLNIYKELGNDLDITMSKTGNLTPWAEQGVLLLNSVLTVQQRQAASHQKKGWEIFTDRVIEILNAKKEHLVFMLWGSYAQKKGAHINVNKHLVLKAVHPSPLSAHRGFLGCSHFSQCNEYLKKHNVKPVEWKI